MSFSVHQYHFRIFYDDTDAGGVVYHANFLKYCDRARTEWLRTTGFDQTLLREAHNTILIVTSVSCEFLRPARLDDELTIFTRMKAMKGPRLYFFQTVQRHSVRLAELSVTVATVDAAGGPKRVPAPLRKTLSGLVGIHSDTHD